MRNSKINCQLVLIATLTMAIAILAPVLVFAAQFAQLDLEQIYPDVTVGEPPAAGSEPIKQTITGEARLPDLIRYFTNWAIVLAAVAVVVSLVIAGIQYLTSSGDPNKMGAAKSRIFNSFLGLAILAGSYLILVTINPQLTILSMVVQSLDSGIVLLTEDGYDAITGPDNKKLSDVISEGDARIFASDIADLTHKTAGFGPLVKTTPEQTINGNPKVNFAGFPLYAIGFWGPEGGFADNVKIVAYDNVNFQQTDATDDKLKPREYTREGKLDSEGGTNPAKGFRSKTLLNTDPPLDIILLEDSDFFLSKVGYVNYNKADYEEELGKERKLKEGDLLSSPSMAWHPPLSIMLQGIGPGVYLYSDKGGQRYLLNNHEDFTFSDMSFDNLADKIEINNYEKDDDLGEPTHNYLAVLHDYFHFSGNLRLFFTKTTKEPSYIPKIYLEPGFNKNDVLLCSTMVTDSDLCYLGDSSYLQGNAEIYDLGKFTGQEFYPGNIDLGVAPDEKKTKKEPINDIKDIYGVIGGSEKASSLQLFELVPAISMTGAFEWTDFGQGSGREKECREVRLCTKKGGAGNCISYTPGGRANSYTYNSIHLPMPFFVPVNIPKKLKGVMKMAYNEGDKYEIKEGEFADGIKSVIIRGDCLVVLFENSVEDLAVDTNKILRGSWRGGTPGAHSETFLKSDHNLTDNEIGRCGGTSFFGLIDPKGCASAIAVFPIKLIEE